MKKILYCIIIIIISIMIIPVNSIAHNNCYEFQFRIIAKVYTIATFDKGYQKYIQIIIQENEKFISVIVFSENIVSFKRAKNLRLGNTFFASVHRRGYKGEASYIVDYLYIPIK